MSTLDAFGFAKGKRSKGFLNNQNVQLQQNSNICSFIPPSFDYPLIKKKPVEVFAKPVIKKTTSKKRLTKPKTNHTITQFFSPVLDIEMKETKQQEDIVDDEPVIICTIRNKRSFIDDFWNVIQEEYAQDNLYDEEEKEKEEEEEVVVTETNILTTTKRKREETQLVPYKNLAKKKKTIDIELSAFMKNFLNIQEKRRFTHNTTFNMQQNIEAMEQDDEEDDEDLSRTLKCRLTISQSQALFLQITNELLYS